MLKISRNSNTEELQQMYKVNEQNNKEKASEHLGQEELAIIGSIGISQINFTKEEENTKEQEIACKIASGDHVNANDLSYIKSKNPSLLSRANDAKHKKELIEKELKDIQSKEEAREILRKIQFDIRYLEELEKSSQPSDAIKNIQAINEARENVILNIKRSANFRKTVNKLV